VPRTHSVQTFADERHRRRDLTEREQSSAEAVVQIVIVVGDIVRKRSKLCLRPRVRHEVEVVKRIVAAKRPARRRHRPVVLGKPLQRFPRKVEPVEIGVADLERGQHPDRVAIVVESAPRRHARGEHILADMAERRMPEVVRKAERFGQVFIELQRAR